MKLDPEVQRQLDLLRREVDKLKADPNFLTPEIIRAELERENGYRWYVFPRRLVEAPEKLKASAVRLAITELLAERAKDARSVTDLFAGI